MFSKRLQHSYFQKIQTHARPGQRTIQIQITFGIGSTARFISGKTETVINTDTEFPLFRSHDIDLFEENFGEPPLNRMLA